LERSRSAIMSPLRVSESWREDHQVSSEVVCAIDVGSKNLKLESGYRELGRIVTRRMRKVTLNLGEEVRASGGVIREHKLLELRSVLAEFRECGERNGTSRLMAVGTNALRQARNRDQVLALADELEIELEIADGRREGELGYAAATLGEPNHLVSELGSHSMQVAWLCGGPVEVLHREAGYVFAYDSFVQAAPGMAEAYGDYRAFLERELNGIPASACSFIALSANSAVGFAVGRDKGLVNDTTFPRSGLRRKLQALRGLTRTEFSELKAKTEKASKVLPGLIFLDYVLERAGRDEVRVAEAELATGLIIEHFRSRNAAREALSEADLGKPLLSSYP
jgi:exopolyphosphatase/guanosine-5'-triphosphate,3'-diphosphate pyrophosphatase